MSSIQSLCQKHQGSAESTGSKKSNTHLRSVSSVPRFMIPTTVGMKSPSLSTYPGLRQALLRVGSMMSSLRIHLGLKFAGRVQAPPCKWLLL